jgi:hypothetical protein
MQVIYMYEWCCVVINVILMQQITCVANATLDTYALLGSSIVL